jgi:hypothetical protein
MCILGCCFFIITFTTILILILSLFDQGGKCTSAYRAYVFDLHSKNENSVRWRCSTRNCKEYIIIKHGIEVFCSNDHTHPNDELKIGELSLLGKLREKARKTQNSAVEIIKRETCSLNYENLSKIPKYSYLNDAIKRKK